MGLFSEFYTSNIEDSKYFNNNSNNNKNNNVIKNGDIKTNQYNKKNNKIRMIRRFLQKPGHHHNRFVITIRIPVTLPTWIRRSLTRKSVGVILLKSTLLIIKIKKTS